MNNLLHRDSDFEQGVEDTSGVQGDREITLGTTMILAIFFALAVFAAIFFGFGYSMGSKRAAAVQVATAPAGNGSGISAAKPAAGSPSNANAPSASAQNLRGGQTNTESAPASAAAPTASAKHPQPAPVAAAGPALPAASQPVVQVAAVSHQEDADLLVSTLKRRGYAVAVRNDPRDKLLHVQVGPFATRQEADAMRQRLIADGFNAMVKEPGR